MPTKLLQYRLSTLLSISLIWLIFGIIFFENLIHANNDLGIDVSLLQFSITFGIIGFIITGSLIFYLKPAFHHQPLWISILIKLFITIILFVVIAFLIFFIYYAFIYERSFQDYVYSFFTKVIRTHTFFSFILDLGVMTLLSIILLEITDKYGPGMFWSMLTGEYHIPKDENRIFVFLDINESTTIAEDLGHGKYFYMLRRFFRDITFPVLANDGEIYQYVGDEIVLTWKNTPENKIKSLKFIRNTYFLIERLSNTYEKNFGYVPRFKAGIHAGEVTAGFVGILKKELVYTGDTMNTTARIRSMCSELDEAFIISEDFMLDFYQPHGYDISTIGEIELKGRSETTKLYSLKFE